jgi:hypothetical protein
VSLGPVDGRASPETCLRFPPEGGSAPRTATPQRGPQALRLIGINA